MSNLVFLAAMAICAWNIANGLRTGRMRFGMASVTAYAEKARDPRTFWFYGGLNLGGLVVGIVGLMRTISHQ